MDTKFYEQVVGELRKLLEDEQNGVKPRNPELRDAVYAVLRKQPYSRTPPNEKAPPARAAGVWR